MMTTPTLQTQLITPLNLLPSCSASPLCRQPLNARRTPLLSPKAEENNNSAASPLPLNHHPNWFPFLEALHATILKHSPAFRIPFLELLERADQLW